MWAFFLPYFKMLHIAAILSDKEFIFLLFDVTQSATSSKKVWHSVLQTEKMRYTTYHKQYNIVLHS